MMRDRPARDGGIVGGLVTAALTVVWYGGWQLAGLAFVPFDLFDWIARVLPGPIVTFAIDSGVSLGRALNVAATGAAAKTAEQTLAIVLTMGAGVAAATILFVVLSLSDESALLAGAILGGMLGAAGLVVENSLRRIADRPLVGATWIVVTLLIWGLALGWLYDRLRAMPVEAAESLEAGELLGRRRFLKRLAVSVGVPALLTALWGLVAGRHRSGTAGRRWSDDHALPNASAAVAPVAGTRRELTPLEDHYRIDIDTRVPAIDGGRWRLKIGGLVDRVLELTLDDLRGEEQLDQFVTLSCISNPLGGDLIGTTRWTGVSLQHLISRAAIDPRATHVKVTSADGFFEVVSLETIRNDPRVMLAYAWDGAPLFPEHGFPLRIYLPDLYGMKQPKWIVSIEAIERWEPGYWVLRGWDRQGRVKATSVIDVVDTRDTNLDSSGRRTLAAGGIAYAGARGISKVEVRVDEGEWRTARLRDPLSDTTWVVWRADLQSQPGGTVVSVRCYESDGTIQAGDYHFMHWPPG